MQLIYQIIFQRGWTVMSDQSLIRTIEVLSDTELMAQIRKSKRKGVKSRDFEEVAEEMGI
jgi:hypothetical protein